MRTGANQALRFSAVWVPETVSCLVGQHCGTRDESVTPCRSCDMVVTVWLVWWVGGDGWSLVERTVGPVRVVMIDVVDDKLVELATVPDDGAVEELASQDADPSVRRTRSPRGRARAS